MTVRETPGRRPPRLALLGLCIVLCLTLSACVSRNVERIDDEEAAAMESPPPPTSAGEAPAREAPGAEQGAAITGTLTVAGNVDGVPGGVLFLIVRVAGRESGAPLAVKRLESTDLPTEFSVTEADAMMPGTPFVGEMDVIARLDQDGDAFTEQPGDLLGRVGPVQAGDDVEIVLREGGGSGPGP